MFSQAQSVHASRDLSNAVTFSYLLSTIRIPCRHCNYVFASPVGTCISRFIKHSHFQLLAIYDSHTLSALHLKVSQAQSVHASNIFSQAHAVGTSISRLSNAVTFYLHLWIRIPCVWFAYHVGTVVTRRLLAYYYADPVIYMLCVSRYHGITIVSTHSRPTPRLPVFILYGVMPMGRVPMRRVQF